jgi:hypothetical protein
MKWHSQKGNSNKLIRSKKRSCRRSKQIRYFRSMGHANRKVQENKNKENV